MEMPPSWLITVITCVDDGLVGTPTEVPPNEACALTR